MDNGRLLTDAMLQLSGRSGDHVILARSASSAFLGYLLALDCGPGDEIILPVSICQAIVNAVLLAGSTPILADCDDQFALRPAAAVSKLTSKTRVVVHHHPFGLGCDLTPLRRSLLAYPQVQLLEDCAQAPGAWVCGKPVGSSGDAALFSFGRRKPIDAGIGGVIIVRPELARRVERALRVGEQGWPDHHLLGISSSLSPVEQRTILMALAKYPRRCGDRIEKVCRALGQPLTKDRTMPSNVYHRLVLQFNHPVTIPLPTKLSELCQMASPPKPPYAVSFMRKRLTTMGRGDLVDPTGETFPMWRDVAPRTVLIRTGPEIDTAAIAGAFALLGYEP